VAEAERTLAAALAVQADEAARRAAIVASAPASASRR
jgi:hypothetical protein